MADIVLIAEIEIEEEDSDKEDSTGLTQGAWNRLHAAVSDAGFSLADVTVKEVN